ncbi:MAG TPA: NAD(P)-dependent oxidoreductase [Ignavibacteria bacterium]|nr:NAD(P)-dependent oxidoreductase [Ignavibacteria bacterium]
MKILITGGSGLLGQYLNCELYTDNEILTLYNENEGNCREFNSLKSDLSDIINLEKIFSEFKPDVVIHSAAISRPEQCDALPEEYVRNVNIVLTENFAELCLKYNSKLIFTSTDLVYDGDQGRMLTEESILNPVSFYAATKVESEESIKKIFDNYIILRTSLLYGMGMNHSVNNFHIMYNNFVENKRSKLFYDQFRTPLSLKNAAEIISELITKDIKNVVLNFGGRERVSRVEIAEITCDVCNFDRSLIEKVSMYEVENLHKVADVSLNTDKLQSFGIKQKSIEESVSEIVRKLKVKS